MNAIGVCRWCGQNGEVARSGNYHGLCETCQAPLREEVRQRHKAYDRFKKAVRRARRAEARGRQVRVMSWTPYTPLRELIASMPPPPKPVAPEPKPQRLGLWPQTEPGPLLASFNPRPTWLLDDVKEAA